MQLNAKWPMANNCPSFIRRNVSTSLSVSVPIKHLILIFFKQQNKTKQVVILLIGSVMLTYHEKVSRKQIEGATHAFFPPSKSGSGGSVLGIRLGFVPWKE